MLTSAGSNYPNTKCKWLRRGFGGATELEIKTIVDMHLTCYSGHGKEKVKKSLEPPVADRPAHAGHRFGRESDPIANARLVVRHRTHDGAGDRFAGHRGPTPASRVLHLPVGPVPFHEVLPEVLVQAGLLAAR